MEGGAAGWFEGWDIDVKRLVISCQCDWKWNYDTGCL